MSEPAFHISEKEFQAFQALMEVLEAAETDDFLELAKLLGRNSKTDLIGADLSGINLRDADLSGANLSGANLRDADLSGANLSGANLRDADLSGANLRDVDLKGSTLEALNSSSLSTPINAPSIKSALDINDNKKGNSSKSASRIIYDKKDENDSKSIFNRTSKLIFSAPSVAVFVIIIILISWPIVIDEESKSIFLVNPGAAITSAITKEIAIILSALVIIPVTLLAAFLMSFFQNND